MAAWTKTVSVSYWKSRAAVKGDKTRDYCACGARKETPFCSWELVALCIHTVLWPGSWPCLPGSPNSKGSRGSHKSARSCYTNHNYVSKVEQIIRECWCCQTPSLIARWLHSQKIQLSRYFQPLWRSLIVWYIVAMISTELPKNRYYLWWILTLA